MVRLSFLLCFLLLLLDLAVPVYPEKGLGESELLSNPPPCIGFGIAIISMVLLTPYSSGTETVTAVALVNANKQSYHCKVDII